MMSEREDRTARLPASRTSKSKSRRRQCGAYSVELPGPIDTVQLLASLEKRPLGTQPPPVPTMIAARRSASVSKGGGGRKGDSKRGGGSGRSEAGTKGPLPAGRRREISGQSVSFEPLGDGPTSEAKLGVEELAAFHRPGLDVHRPAPVLASFAKRVGRSVATHHKRNSA